MAGRTERDPRRRAAYWAAATAARAGNEMFPVAVVLLVLGRGGGAGLAGAAVAAFTLPSVVTGPVLGAWLDRSRRRGLVIASDQALAALCFAGLALVAGDLVWATLALAALAGIAAPLSMGGFTSLLGAIYDAGELPTANARETISFNAAAVAGPALAGIAATAIGPAAAVAAQAGLKLAALVLVLALRLPDAEGAGVRVAGGRSILLDARDGLVHVVRTAPLLAVTAAGSVALAGRGLLTLAFPLWAAGELGTGRDFGAWLWTALALGSIAGAWALTRPRGAQRAEVAALRGIGLAGAVMLSWPLAHSPVPALALVALAGAAYAPGLAATIAVRQRWTPAPLHGRVFTTAASVKPGSFALGAAAAGPVTASVGAPETLAIAAAMQLIACAIGALLLARGGRASPADPD